jgi:SAM-dependent methyltransferase
MFDALATCLACGSNNLSLTFPFGDRRILECPECGLQSLDPQPDDATLAGIYSDDYFFGEPHGVSTLEVADLKQASAALFLDDILGLEKHRPGRLLEIGCAHGDFLQVAQQRRFEIHGVEYSPDAVNVANRRLGRSCVQQGTAESANLPKNYFDVVFLSDVIEHVRNPKRFITALRDSLKLGGLIYIATPSTDSWSRKLMGRHWMEYKLEHLFYFNRRSLAELLQDNGFSEIRLTPNYKFLNFNYIHLHFRRYPVPFWSVLLHGISHVIPDHLAKQKVKIVASGVVAAARNQSRH